MNLLLLLSALLSALTGVGGQARAPQVAATLSVAVDQTAEKTASVAGLRPQVALPGMVVLAAAPLAAALPLTPSEPIFAGRRRE